ncbi:hypothetical protein JOD96_004302 [Flavobacterium sp. 1355]|nr:hypothetical protein [Flavobacterium sp. 1355]
MKSLRNRLINKFLTMYFRKIILKSLTVIDFIEIIHVYE